MSAKRKPGRPGTRIAEGDRLTVSLHVRLSPATAAKLDELAETNAESRTDVIASAIDRMYDQAKRR